MKSKRSFWGAVATAVAAFAVVGSAPAFAQTEFTYQGQLRDVGVPANGEYDFIFLLYDASDGGSQVGIPASIDDWPVENGVFTVELDFGTSVFTGAPRWLQILVRPGASGGLYAGLTPRQPLTAVPYAMYAFDGPGGGGGDGFWAASGADIYNINDGFVGIGTSDPLDDLHIFGTQPTLRLDNDSGPGSYSEFIDATTQQLRINKSNSSSVLLDLNPKPTDGTGSAEVRFFRETDTTGTKRVQFLRGNFSTSASASIGVDGGNSFFQNHGGNVGIGTSSPTAKLHVSGVAGEDGIRFPDGTLQTTAAIGGGDGSLWSLNGSTAYYNSGSVGIGTNTPQGELEVRSSTFPNLRIAKIHTGGFGIAAPAVLELQSNFPGTEGPYGSMRYLDGDNVVRGSVDYGPGPGLLEPVGMRIATEGQTRMSITADGNVGVGTTAPTSKFHVAGNSSSPVVTLSNSGTGRIAFMEATNTNSNVSAVRIDTHSTNNNAAAIAGVNLGGGVGVLGQSNEGGAGIDGVGTPGVRGTAADSISYGGMFIGSGSGPALLSFGDAHLAGKVAIGTTSVPSGVQLNVVGKTRTNVLEVTGADLAEKFPTSEASNDLKPGTVMEIDPDNAGKLRVSREAYNRRVAGIVSGAGDLPAGAILGNIPGNEDAPAIALSGRVWVKCDATQHAVAPGDLLTTAARAGHAMRAVEFAQSQGALIGKAMTSLAKGEQGLVLVLVSLQ